MKLNITVIYGSVRTARQGIKAARWMVDKLKQRGHVVELVDPLVYQLPIIDKMYTDYDTAPENLQKLAKLYKKTDLFVVVSAEYNHSIPPALSNLIDYFGGEYLWRPSAIVTYSSGGFGGVRVASQLRTLLAEVGMPAISSSFPISKVQDSFDETGNALDEAYERRVVKFLDELEWYARAFKAEREKGVPY